MPKLLHRLLATLFGIWFTVITVEPARLHSCPMHDGLAVSAPESGHAGHGGHHNHGAPATHQGSGDQDAPSHHACTCLGTCSTSSATPAAPVTPTFDVALTTAAHSGLPEYSRPTTSVAYAIPFGNGPPRA